MMIRDLAVAMMFFQAARTVDLPRRKVLGAIERKEIITIPETKLLETLTTSYSRKDFTKCGSQLLEVDRVEDLSHACVAGNFVHAKNQLQVLLVLLPALVERQQRRIF